MPSTWRESTQLTTCDRKVDSVPDKLSHCCEFQKHWNRTQPVIIIISISESYYDKLCYCSYFDKSEATSLEHFRHICKANFYSNVSVVVHAVDNKTPLYVITDLYGPSRL